MEAPDSISVYEEKFPRSGSLESQIRYLLTSAIRAPSTHNSQPWLFEIKGGLVRIYRDTKIVLPYSDAKSRYAHVSIGFLLHHIAVLTAYSGMKCSISPIMQDNLIAELSLSSSDGFSPSYQNLARAILIRKNRRGGFLPQPIPADILKEAISNSPLLPDGLVLTEVSAIASPDGKSTLAELTAGNMKRVYSIPAFRREMSKWITPTGSPKRTGLPGYTLNQPVLMSWILPTIIRFVNMGPVLAKLNYGALATSSAIVGFGNTESPLGWVSTGFQASHTALTLVAHELNYSVFVAAIEYDDTRKKANDVFGLHYPLQFLFAAGKLPGEVDWKTPRIPIEKKSL